MRLPDTAPTIEELLSREAVTRDLPRVVQAAMGSPNNRYLHWDELRGSQIPEGLSREQWWAAIKFGRAPMARPFQLLSTSGRAFTYTLPDSVLKSLHWIDQHAAGELVVTETFKDSGERRRYLVNSLFEEAITSSQLEGASATRQVAKEMLRTGRPPRDRSERMILNNFRAMSEVRSLASEPLTPDAVFDLHRILTQDTLDNADAAGRMQLASEDRVVVEAPDGTIVHQPPPADQLVPRMHTMCEFANGRGVEGFVHPVIRAILLHLWLAYDHPFEDGNGRTARALFYREMLAQGYWLFEYVTISRLLLKAPVQYGRAFLYTETDQFDATYFIVHQLDIIRRAIDELMAYLRRKMQETRETIQLLRRADLNHRQVALLTHALRHGDATYTYQSHATSHRVVRQSARTDLIDLEERGLLVRQPVRGKVYFKPVVDLHAKLGV